MKEVEWVQQERNSAIDFHDFLCFNESMIVVAWTKEGNCLLKIERTFSKQNRTKCLLAKKKDFILSGLSDDVDLSENRNLSVAQSTCMFYNNSN
ncbi:hypothetical protein BpHYR1_014412 [Brachionus plicatilis]|uniref:Uncharacterized protein n=1 Tax=Brachionus plicatilis TaxID=10195 RepID=A0A3M7PN59_BRAPC|nr:hypothetical protein BpHYR1_014412 [Brachionus plicatilis]